MTILTEKKPMRKTEILDKYPNICYKKLAHLQLQRRHKMSEIDFDYAKRGIELIGGIKILPANAPKQNKWQTGLYEHPLPMGMMNFSVLIERDGFVADVIRTFQLERLDHIHQLQSLTYFGIDQMIPRLPGGDHVFPHTRLMPHAILSGVLRALIAGYIQKANPPETRIAILEDLIHDVATCAGGDAWHNIDLPDGERNLLGRTLFNEDSHILKVFEWRHHDWRKLKEKYGLPDNTPELVHRTISSEHGLNGAIHTFTDTLSYLAGDVGALVSLYFNADLQLPKRLLPITELATPDVFNLWQNLAIKCQKIVVKKPDILSSFLKLRLAMFTEIYNHPDHKVIEMMMASVVYPQLWKKIRKRPEALLHQQDDDLSNMIEAEMRMKNIALRLDAFETTPLRFALNTKKDALKMERQLAERGYLTLFIDYGRFKPIKTKSSKYLVEGRGGKPISFKNAFPEVARQLEIKAKSPPDGRRFHLVVYEKAKMSAELRRAWQEARKRWHSAK